MVAINTEKTRPVTLDRTQLELIQTPQPTLTWSPIPHHHLVDKVQDRLQQQGLRVQTGRHTVTHGTNRYFGTLELMPEPGREYRRMVGIRNSHDKKFSASIVAGARVIVCSNGMFVGEELCLAVNIPHGYMKTLMTVWMSPSPGYSPNGLPTIAGS